MEKHGLTRAEFLKKLGLASLAFGYVLKGNAGIVQAANVSDNLGGGGGGGGIYIKDQPPASKKKLWVSTSGTYGVGVAYYFSPSANAWVPLTSTWNA